MSDTSSKVGIRNQVFTWYCKSSREITNTIAINHYESLISTAGMPTSYLDYIGTLCEKYVAKSTRGILKMTKY